MKSSEFTIKEQELAKALGIEPEQLDEIIDFFNSDPDDEWELRENDHFIYVNKTWKERLFSQLGAFAVAKYMDSKEKKTLWGQVVEFITGHKAKIRNAFVRQKVQENCSSLTLRNNRHFLSKKDVVNILCTSYARINRAFEDVQKSDDPMELEKDYSDIEQMRYYSFSGLDRLSRVLSKELKDRDRREWCAAVEVVGSRTLKLLVDEAAARRRKVEAAMRLARKRDDERCQITNQKATKYNKLGITVHHIFCQKHYPHLAMSLDNLITLTDIVHQEFHCWNGGFDKPCSLDDLIRFVNEQYPDNEKISVLLNQKKYVFGGVQQAA